MHVYGDLHLEFPEFEFNVLWPNLVLIAQIPSFGVTEL